MHSHVGLLPKNTNSILNNIWNFFNRSNNNKKKQKNKIKLKSKAHSTHKYHSQHLEWFLNQK
jgi:hypothetical protein